MPDDRPELRRELRLWHLVLFNISAVAGVRWLAAAAQAGPGSLTLWLLSALGFFLPSALVVSSLSARFPEEGGFYVWTKRAFGDWHGFLCAWVYFVSNILYFPTLLLSGVAMASYMFGETGIKYSENPSYAIPVTLTALWIAFGANLLGLRVGKWPTILGGGSTYIVAALLCVFAVIIAWRFGSATRFQFLPDTSLSNLNFWSQIALAMTGLELAPILGGEIHDPSRNVPRAAWISGFGCAGFYIAGTAALLTLLPPDRISPMTGLAQAGNEAGAPAGRQLANPVLRSSHYAGGDRAAQHLYRRQHPAALRLGLDHYLPPAFARLHPRWHTPHISILMQGVLSSVLLVLMELGENLRAGYQILVDMVVIATLIPFVYIFASRFQVRAALGRCYRSVHLAGSRDLIGRSAAGRRIGMAVRVEGGRRDRTAGFDGPRDICT